MDEKRDRAFRRSGAAQESSWSAWPSREALTRMGVPRGRVVLDYVMVTALSGWVLAGCYTSGRSTAGTRPCLRLASGSVWRRRWVFTTRPWTTGPCCRWGSSG